MQQENELTGLSQIAAGNELVEIPQYGLGKILLIWVGAAGPMAVLEWIVNPALSPATAFPLFTHVALLTLGLVWQFVLVVILLGQETRTWSWAIIRQRLWLRQPYSEKQDRTDRRLWWWLLPMIFLTALYEFKVGGAIDGLWTSVFPFLREPPAGSLSAALATPEARAGLVGAWGFYGLFIVQAIFNTVIGEELLFRGVLLPRMAGVFGKWDWVANGVLFGFYHWHKPWIMLSAALEAVFLFVLPSRRFHSAWFGIIAHSGQSVYFAFLLLGLVLGKA